MNRRALPLLLTLSASHALTGQASAATAFTLMPTALTTAIAFSAQPACQVLQPGVGTAAPAADPFAKTAALLGGAPSQLELIMRQQSGAAAPTGGATTGFAAGGISAPAGVCIGSTNLAASRTGGAPITGPITIALQPRATIPGEFLASRRLPISRTGFDDEWQRVSRHTLPGRLARGIELVSGGGTGRYSQLLAVNAWTNGHIRYAEDKSLFGKADYWADAGTTLRLRAGDCEDIAILKMQLLAAAGVPRDAMFLTIARDLVRNADHAMLVVRDGNRFWLLDNATNALSDASGAADYRPIMSFSGKGKWLHGY